MVVAVDDDELLEHMQKRGLLLGQTGSRTALEESSEIFSDERRELVKNNPHLSSNCIVLHQKLEEMVGLHCQLKRHMKRRESPAHDAFFAAYDYLAGLFGRKSYTMERLFDIQLDNIRYINGELGNIISYSRDELLFLEKYREDVSKRVGTGIGSRKSSRDNVDAMTQQYKQLRQQIGQMQTTDAQYFIVKNSLANLKNRIKEAGHGYVLSSDSVDDDSREFKFLIFFEDLLRESIHITERYHAQVSRREQHLSKTKRAYQALKTMQETTSMLFETMESVTGYTMYVHNLIGDGMRFMAQTLNSPNLSNNFYGATTAGMGNVLDYIDGVKQRNLADVEKRLDNLK